MSHDESTMVENKWKGVNIDYVIYFSRVGEWGYIAPAFNKNRVRYKQKHIILNNNRVKLRGSFDNE